MNKILLFLIKVIISFGVLAYFFSRIEPGLYFKILKDINILYFLIGLAFHFGSFFIYTYRWQLFLKMLEVKVDFKSLFALNLSSMFYASFLPGGLLAGETVKCYKVAKGNNEKGRRLFSVLLDRFTGALSFIILGFISILAAGYRRPEILIIYSFLVMGALFLYLVLGNLRIRKFFKDIIIKFFIKEKEKADIFSKEKYIKFFTVNLAVFWGIILQLMSTLGLYFFVLALGEDIFFLHLIWIFALVGIVTMLPLTFLGIGIRDLSMVYLLGQFGFSTEAALGAATLILIALLFRGFLGGMIELAGYFKTR